MASEATGTPSEIPHVINVTHHGIERNIVGSPEQVSSPPLPLQSIATADGAEDVHGPLQRPALGRSVSSSAALPGSQPDTVTKLNEMASNLVHLTQRKPRTGAREREWSVFGQLMDDEERPRVARTGGTLHGGRRRQNGASRPSDTHTSHQTRPSFVGDEPLPESQASSPVTDRHMESIIPSSYDVDSPSERSSSSDESEDRDRRTPQGSPNKLPSGPSFLRLPTLPVVWRNILKCSVAYFIGSLFTFSPYLSGFIAGVTGNGFGSNVPSPSGHMVATVAVYFNPAKTLGGMVEADVFCSMGLLFAAFVSLSSMTMFWFFEVRRGWEWLADILVLLWIGIGMSAVAWMKVWMAKPTFNTACSMTAIILFVVVVKEGGVQTLLQVSFIVFVGSLISNMVCATLWPQRATKNLQDTMTKTLDSFSTLLGMLTETFLLEDSLHSVSQGKLQRAVDNHQASFTSLKKNLAEAQSEQMFGGPSKGTPAAGIDPRQSSGQAYEDAVDSLNRLGQHLNGLRSGTVLQYELIKAQRTGKVVIPGRPLSSHTPSNGKSPDGSRAITEDNETDIMLQAAADMFGDLMDDLGPPLKALSTSCATSLKRLREAFVQPRSRSDKDTIRPEEFEELAHTIERALFTFESTSNHAVIRLYRSGNRSGLESRGSLSSLDGENPRFSGIDGESIFLVYFFIFTLQELAKELISLADAMGRICSIERAQAARGWWGKRLWASLKSGNGLFHRKLRRTSREKRRGGGMRRRFSVLFVPEPHRVASFPKIKPHAPNTIQTPARANLSLMGRVKQSLWALGSRLKEPDLKYAIKTGMATAMLAAPAFFDSTRPVFVEYRGEWALISFFVVMSPTIGATNNLSVHRVLGTLCGAATAAAVWTAFPENPYALSAFGFLFSIPCFYYIVAKPQYATSSRFVLLTYNLTCLYCYNLRQKDIEVIEVAFHRAVAVTAGVVWAAIVSHYWWPTEARRELGRALGDFCLNMGWLYTRLVAFNSCAEIDNHFGHEDQVPDRPTESTALLTTPPSAALSESIQHFMAMELHLQIKLIELQGLLAQTQHEPRLKGPFPVALYRSILISLQTILDKLHSMRCVTAREEWHTSVHQDFIVPVNRERREMVGSIILYFSVLAAAFRLKSPLPPYLPPAEDARQRLVDALRKLDVVRNRDVKGSRHLLFFAYALTMKSVIQELDFLGRTLQEAFGVIGQSVEEFEALFRDSPIGTSNVV
ncbi:hypothetical protein CERSUDRAFT_87077 [Gelatoporia subvermispora B]|uniref:Uncharacterized protein n=1 Tax=Ceriporiopsis subvermispora (strain B) TaxID=914234 RepID=M2PD87_CERS8|nr:hypothetical protein CERSUDRAFT_87077 [Gelatoporia subvermispora B]